MTINTVKIENFLSVKYLTFDFSNGLHLLTGTNGVGKSTILQAVSVGLFNKSERPMPWGRIGGPGGFKITVEFVDNSNNIITVINDRARNRFEVYENEELLTHQITRGLPIVAKKLDMTYHEFTILSFLTPQTISGVLTGTDSSLISKFFNLSVLSTYDKQLKEEKRILNRDKRDLESRITKSIDNSKEYNVEELSKTLSNLKIQKMEIQDTLSSSTNITTTENALSITCARLSELSTKLGTERDKLRTLESIDSICPTCGSDLSNDTTNQVAAIITLRKGIKELTKEENSVNKEMVELSTHLQHLREPLEGSIKEVTERILNVEAELLAANIIDSREVEDITKLNDQLGNIENNIHIIDTTIKAIKSGEVHRTYLQTFVAVLNGNLEKLKDIVNINMTIISKIDDKGLSFSILDNGVYKFSDGLSAGEKVIVGLLVLSSMFTTLKETLNIDISLVLLDEAISAVSRENMEVIEKILQDLAEDRCIIITQHHDELPKSMFDYIHKVVKVDNLTEII